jgi:hypothetical protein
MERDRNSDRGRPGADRPRERPLDVDVDVDVDDDDDARPLDDVGAPPAESPAVDDV